MNFITTLQNTEKYKSFLSNLSIKTPYKITGMNLGVKSSWFASFPFDSYDSTIIVTNSKEEEDFLSSFFENLNISFEIFPSLELSPYEEILTDVNIVDKQFQIIEKLLTKKIKVVLTKTKGLTQKLLSEKDLKENIITVRKGQVISPSKFVEELVRLGYNPTETLERKGDFSRRGGIINFIPLGYSTPVKIEWFDDEIELIREYDLLTKKAQNDIDLLTIYPTSKIMLPKIIPNNFKEGILKTMMEQIVKVYNLGFTKNAEDLRKKIEKDLNDIKNLTYTSALYGYFNFLYKDSASLLDFLPKNSVVVWSDFTAQNSFLKKLEETLEETLKNKLEKGFLLENTGKLFISLDELLKKSRNFIQIRLSNFNDMPNVNLQYSGTSLPPFNNKFEDLILYIKKLAKEEEKNTLIITAQPQRALTLLREKDCEAFYGHDYDLSTVKGKIFIEKGSVQKGFILNDINTIVVTDAELFGWSQRPVTKKSKDKKDNGIKITKVQDIKIGDYVVHHAHGIGQYKGLRTVEIQGRKREYFEIIYSKEDKLLVPIEQINLLSLYRGSSDVPPRLSKMGGVEWENLKSRIRDSVRNIAGELIALYAKRATAKGNSFMPDTEWQGQMEDAFPYDETPDQLTAILDTKADMEKDKPMDRLICGDVGFGKTEVAIRAVFKAIMSGKQVAVVAPTTVLSQQLYDVMHQRFSPYPIKMAIVNRFRSSKESKTIYEELKKGNLDLIVSTHKILMSVPDFFDLGLLVIDEEHKFGVAHKEKLKQFKASIDVLTMSATPIPRTLYMALSGARDISVIETPPKNRFPVITKISQYSAEVVKNAILHEMERGGQVYFLHNRVESLDRVHKDLKEMLPDVRIGVAHGQLPEHELENAMLDFNNREFDVLLCTTIIESGLDIPTANTIIIDQVQILGLAQIYQLRGRVGRSDIQAYCYMLYPNESVLTDEAKQRLQVISDISNVGTGYQVALRDMEIRGVGDLLGAEQHGNMINVGYDTYCEILEEAINELKPEEERTNHFAQNVVIDINLPCYIPDTWIEDYKYKMQVYRRLAVMNDLDLLEDLRSELRENYKDIPTYADNLLKIVKIRIMSSKLGIKNIKSIDKQIRVSHKIEEKKWRDFINKNSDLMRWQWSLTELITKAGASPEVDLSIIEKLISCFYKL
ncbi:MAG: transcription-repair coupling factor [Candidatus Sericytochromatia bacterium]